MAQETVDAQVCSCNSRKKSRYTPIPTKHCRPDKNKHRNHHGKPAQSHNGISCDRQWIRESVLRQLPPLPLGYFEQQIYSSRDAERIKFSHPGPIMPTANGELTSLTGVGFREWWLSADFIFNSFCLKLQISKRVPWGSEALQ